MCIKTNTIINNINKLRQTFASRRPDTSRGVREELRLRATDEGGSDSSRLRFRVTLRDLLDWTT